MCNKLKYFIASVSDASISHLIALMGRVPDATRPTRRMSLKVALRHAKAKVPTKGSQLAAGYDLYSSEDTVIVARGRGVVQTGISIALPEGTYGRVAPRSGLAVKNGIDTGAGVVDADYRGLLGVVLFNNSDEDFHVKTGDRIAQLVVEKIWTGDIVVADSLDDTERAEGGFGSTGTK